MTAAPTPARTAAVALAVTLAIQLFTSLASVATPVLAPVIAGDLRVSTKLIGIFVGLVYFGGAVASLAAGGFIARFGPIRVSQVASLICVAGLGLMTLATTGWVPLALVMVVAPIVIGVGYGPITAASSQLLIRTTPPNRIAFTFSLKQTGVPVGAALAGATLPALALTVGWRGAFAAAAVLGIAIVIIAQRTRAAFDTERRADAPISLSGLIEPLKLVLTNRRLRELSRTGFGYAATQMCLTGFLVVYLTEELNYSLVAAGFALTVTNLGGILGRLVWGVVADRFIAPRTLLGGIGVIAGGCAYATALSTAAWPAPAVLALCGLFGATAIGWNGVQLSQVARHAPHGQAGAVTGAAGAVTFSGIVFGPTAFALLAQATGHYAVGFAVFGTLSLASGAALLLRKAP